MAEENKWKADEDEEEEELDETVKRIETSVMEFWLIFSRPTKP